MKSPNKGSETLNFYKMNFLSLEERRTWVQMQIAYWTWKWENEKIPSWWFQCLSEMRVKVKSRDESLGRGNKKFVDKVIHTVRKQCTRQIQLSYRSSSSAPLEFYMIYLKRNQSAWLHFFLAATFIFLYISTELMVGWLNHHRLGFYQEKKKMTGEKRRLRRLPGIIIVISHGLWVSRGKKWL